MNYGLYLSAASMGIQQRRQEVIANNLANTETPSFKRDLSTVVSRPPAVQALGLPAYLVAPVQDGLGGGLTSGPTWIDFSQGALKQTGQDHDLALDGAGFFVVQADSQRRYTRDGRMALDQEGYLVTAAGRHRVLDESGQPIRLPAGPMSVDSSGTITVGQTSAKLALVNFDNPNFALRKAGDNTYALVGSAAEKPSTAAVRQQFLESSGVEPTVALVDMLSAERAYEASSKMVQFSDAMLGQAVNDIARSA